MMTSFFKHTLSGSLLCLAALTAPLTIQAATVGFYAGVDTAATLASGTYAGLPNPNYERLTLLFNHGDHFHGIGAYSYSGPAGSPTVMSTNTNNRIPEISSLEPPLPLAPGSGPVYSGSLVNSPGASEYSHISLAAIDALQGFAPGTDEYVLYNSSSGRWASSLAGAAIALELVSITPGLRIGTESELSVMSAPGDLYLLGGSSLSFTPLFSVDDSASGVYSAEFRLHDLRATGTPYGASGTFHFDFEATPVPEPASLALFGCGAALLALVRLRRK
jgi:hypothetical protein